MAINASESIIPESKLDDTNSKSLLTSEKMKDPVTLADLKLDALTPIHIYGYGVGHFLNDLCAACWFNYLLYYLKSVDPIGGPEEAGTYAG